MPYITIAERIGIEKGMKEGIEKGREEGREEGKLIGEILLAQQILNLTIYAEEELNGKNLEELKSIFKQFKAKLNLTCPSSQLDLKRHKRTFSQCLLNVNKNQKSTIFRRGFVSSNNNITALFTCPESIRRSRAHTK